LYRIVIVSPSANVTVCVKSVQVAAGVLLVIVQVSAVSAPFFRSVTLAVCDPVTGDSNLNSSLLATPAVTGMSTLDSVSLLPVSHGIKNWLLFGLL
jgi:hypothetical protein